MERRLLERTEILLPARIIYLLFVFILMNVNTKAALSSYTFTRVTGVAQEDTTGSTQLIGSNLDNVAGGVSGLKNIGFTFTLNGTPYTQFSVNENGVLRLGASVVSTGSATQTTLTLGDLPKITAYFDDMKTVTGKVGYKLFGSAPNRKMVVYWNVTLKVPNTTNSVFQVWLYETSNNIKFVYGQNMVLNTGQYSVGMVGTLATDYVSVNTTTNTASSAVITDNNTAAITSGTAFLFAVAPGCTTSPSPAASATNITSSPTLSWIAGSGYNSGYDVYFGTSNPPPRVSYQQSATSYIPGLLNTNTVYYWKVIPRNDSTQASCSVLQFTTEAPPTCPNYVFPSASAPSVSYYNCTLTWTSGSTNTTGYDVYFGTAPNPPSVSNNQVGTSFNVGNLIPNTQYYWKVIARSGALFSTVCSEQNFTTAKTISYEVTRSTGISFNSISSTGNTVASWRRTSGSITDDNLSDAVPIGFNFNYAGVNYSSLLISTNGFITFNTTTTALGNGSGAYGYSDDLMSNFSATPSTLVLAPFYYDLVCQGNPGIPSGLAQGIHYSLTGTPGSRVMTIEWTGMELYLIAGPDFNFQVKLYEGSNNIDFVYGTMQGYDGTTNTNYSFTTGLNSSTISNPPVSGEVFNQLTPNSRNFGLTPTNSQNTIPACNSMLSFTPGVYTPYVPVSLVPSNDNVANAIVLPVNSSPCFDICGTIYGSANATTSGIAGCSSTNADDDVWFKFTASGISSTTIKVLCSGNYDGVIELFNNSMVSIGCSNLTTAGLSESIVANLTSGQQYFVRVFHRFSGAGGASSSSQFSICVSATPPPPVNDDCVNRINLTVTQFPLYTAGTSTYSATPSPSIPLCAVSGTNPDDDVWYSFTALGATETITVVGGVGFDAVVQLFSGSCNSLVSIACADALHNGQTETITTNNLIAGQVYTIRVYHGGSGGGSGNYSIAVTCPPPPCVGAMAPNNGDTDIPTFGTDLYWDSVPGAITYRVICDTVFPPVKILGVTTDFTMNTGPLYGGKTYYWRVETGNNLGYNTGCQVINFTTENTPISLQIRVFLEGFYTGSQTMLPLINPLDTLTDTITISLADSTKEIIFSQNAYLGIHGWATAHFPIGVFEEYWYLVIDQRNSLEIWSPTMQGLFSPDNTYDFSFSAAQAFGSNQKLLDPGVFGMHIGDINQDGLINATDMTDFMTDAQSFVKDNQLGDLNGDGFAESIDCSILENKFQYNLSVQIPF